MFHVYILQNATGRFYIGQTDDLERRLRGHNNSEGKSYLGKFNHKNGSWALVWAEAQDSHSDAMVREREI